MPRQLDVIANSSYSKALLTFAALGSIMMLGHNQEPADASMTNPNSLITSAADNLGTTALKYTLRLDSAIRQELSAIDGGRQVQLGAEPQSFQQESTSTTTAHPHAGDHAKAHVFPMPTQVSPGLKARFMSEAGIPPVDFGYVNYIVGNESSWCTTKWQGETGYCPTTYQPKYALNSSEGYGLGQATPAIKMAAFGNNWLTNPITQLKWANYYAITHWGGWPNAYRHKLEFGWW